MITTQQLLGEVWMQVRDARRLRELAEMRGLSQRDIARAVWPGTKAHSNVTRILNGQTTTLTPARALRWAMLFDVPVDLLFMPRKSSNAGQTVRAVKRQRKDVAA